MNAKQLRMKRINELIAWAKNHNAILLDRILQEARNRYPYIREKTLRSYAEATLRILKRRELARARGI